MHLVESWFSLLTDRRLRRRTFTSVTELRDAIDLWAEHWDDDPTPFIWSENAQDIIAKVSRG